MASLHSAIPATNVTITMPQPSPEVLNQLLQVVNSVTTHHALSVQWSLWHSWNYINRGNTDLDRVETHAWEDTAPFATCLGQSYSIQKALRAALEQDTTLKQFAKNVLLVSTEERAISDNGYHVLVAMPFEQFCIVSDLSFHSQAFVVPLGGTFKCEEQIVITGGRDSGKFFYTMDLAGVRTLSYRWLDEDKYLYYALDYSIALRQLGIPGAKGTIDKPDRPAVPHNKYAYIRSLLKEQPKHLAWARIDAGYLATACRISVSFEHRSIIMQIPIEDWLKKPENKKIRQKLQGYEHASMCRLEKSDVGHLQVPLGESSTLGRITRANLVMMDRVGAELGLPRGEIIKMAQSVYEVWNQVGANLAIPSNWPTQEELGP